MTTQSTLSSYNLYHIWMVLKNETPIYESEFPNSIYSRSFELFDHFSTKHNLPVMKYIAHMVKLDVPPVIWTSDPIFNEWKEKSA
jgi:hypothetical protein